MLRDRFLQRHDLVMRGEESDATLERFGRDEQRGKAGVLVFEADAVKPDDVEAVSRDDAPERGDAGRAGGFEHRPLHELLRALTHSMLRTCP